MQEIFADGIGSVHVTGKLVRIDLISLQPGVQGKSGEPVYSATNRLIMPVESFVQAFQFQDGVIRKLIESGILTEQKNTPAVEEVEGKSI